MADIAPEDGFTITDPHHRKAVVGVVECLKNAGYDGVNVLTDNGMAREVALTVVVHQCLKTAAVMACAAAHLVGRTPERERWSAATQMHFDNAAGSGVNRTISVPVLESMGWSFVQYGPNDWKWVKFDDAGDTVAQYGDDIWRADVTLAGYVTG